MIKNILIVCVVIALFFSNDVLAGAQKGALTKKEFNIINRHANIDYPKLAIYGTSPHLSKKAVPGLGKLDLVILDFENWVNNPENIKLLMDDYPNVLVLAYTNPMETYYGIIPKRPLNLELSEKILGLTKGEIRTYSALIKRLKNAKSENHKKALAKKLISYNEKVLESPYSKWFLWTTKKNHVVFYTPLPYWMMNLSKDCPKVNGKTWNQFITNYYNKNIFTAIPRPHGSFQDNATADVHWMNNFAFSAKERGWIDANLDGKADEDWHLNDSWKSGQIEFSSILRESNGEDFIMVGNKGKIEYDGVFDGKMFEEFPFSYGGPDKRAGGWFQCMKNYLASGPFSIIQSRQTGDVKFIKFVLASTLMGDGYFAIGHNNRKQYDFYKKIGKPLGSHAEIKGKNIPKKETYWQREFEKATVKVWPYKRRGEIIYH